MRSPASTWCGGLRVRVRVEVRVRVRVEVRVRVRVRVKARVRVRVRVSRAVSKSACVHAAYTLRGQGGMRRYEMGTVTVRDEACNRM